MRWRIGGSTAGWRLARALVALLEYVDSVWTRSHPTDGTVGDLSHQARRSDHNPNSAGVVTAGDVGVYDRAHGDRLVAELVASRDPRIKYIIFNRRIWRSYDKPGIPAWTPTTYTGSNSHTNHVHISVSSSATLYDDPSPWNIELKEEQPMFTPHEVEVLKGIVAHLDAAGSNESFAKYAVDLIRRERDVHPLHELAAQLKTHTADVQSDTPHH